MPRPLILSSSEQQEFDNPPVLSTEARVLCFSINKELENKLKALRTPTNKVGFLIQYAYFKASKRFFVNHQFRLEDIAYAAKLLGLSIKEINMEQYRKKIPADHQIIILKLLGYRRLDNEIICWLEQEIARRVKQFVELRQLFFEILQLLHDHKIEIPSYHRLSELITRLYVNYEDQLLNLIDDKISSKCRHKLDDLLLANKSNNEEESMLSQLKNISQLTNPNAIQASVADFKKINSYFVILLPLINTLKLTPNSCMYYATWVKKAKLSQLKQFPRITKAYLHLIAFIQHQFYLRQDAFVDILLKCVQSVKNSATQQMYESSQLTLKERKSAVRYVTQSHARYKDMIEAITTIVKSDALSDTDKVQQINQLLDTLTVQQNTISPQQIERFEKSLDNLARNKDYFNILENLSTKLQRRVSPLLDVLIFNEATSNPHLIKAIAYFKQKAGNLDHRAPIKFLTAEEQAAIFDETGAFKLSLYKILLFIHIADAIKSGELNLCYSYRYLAIEEYLIDKKVWQEQRNALLQSTGLSDFTDCNTVLAILKQRLDEKYHAVNHRSLAGRNPYLSFKESIPHIATPAIAIKETEYIAALLEQVGFKPILQVLTELNAITHFTRCFKHHSIKYVKQRPGTETFIAGIIGLGCNIGAAKMARISTGINEHTLINAINWYFNAKNLQSANNCLIAMINQLKLPSNFITDDQQLHSSSDGQKINLGVESLLANYSFKYFGKNKGVSVYTFIDEKQALFHSLVMSAAEREAAYVIDGLINNEVTQTHIHSTDSHGYSEIIFAATHFLNIAFAPRIKNVSKQHIYAFSSRKTYQRKGYKLLPSRTINQKLIEKYWDELLRFMVTIKLQEVTASQLFKRLSSYAKDNPLYKALKEFGRIIKSLFILTYYDDTQLRQRIEKQLNRIELANKFSKAVFYANNQEFKHALREEQEVATACKVLIQNAIVLWNYLYLSQVLANCQDTQERQSMVQMIKAGSIITWRHINLHGEFDFRRFAANDSPFDMDKILALRLTE